jgi:hypothetical protein
LRSLFGVALAAVFVAGCGSNVTLDPVTIPAPLIEPMPLSIAIRIPAEFEHFVHEDEVLGREKWRIDLGRSNAALFSQLFEFMFDEVTVIGPGDDASALSIDALIEPSIDAFEFSVPRQSKTEAYAVWIRYRLKIYDSAGDLYANWPLSAYGKSEEFGLTGDEPLKRAAILAMRDAAALTIMNLDKSTAISALKDRPPVSVAAAESQGEQAKTASPKERSPLPKRRDVTLPPPGPVAGPAVLAMDPVDDGPTDTVGEESTND